MSSQKLTRHHGSFNASVPNLLENNNRLLKKILDVLGVKMLEMVEFAEKWVLLPVVPLFLLEISAKWGKQ